MKTCVILGSNSEIAQGLRPLLEVDRWRIVGWNRHATALDIPKWGLVIVALGRVAPVGLWMEQNAMRWEEAIESNLLKPVRLLRNIWNEHQAKSSICFLAGSNPNSIMSGYSAYNVGKMALLKLCEQLDHETPDAKFFALNPGTVLTKIHQASEGWDNAKLAAARDRGEDRAAKLRRIYECLKWCIGQPKEIVGGRNICVSDPWDVPGFLDKALQKDPNLYKLRRYEAWPA